MMSNLVDFLIVEDDLVSSAALQARLKGLGHTSVAANSTDGAIELLNDGLQVLGAIVDIMLPVDQNGKTELNAGIDLAKLIKTKYPAIQIILLTGRVDDELDREIQDAQNNNTVNLAAFFRKPPRAKELRMTLSEIKSGTNKNG